MKQAHARSLTLAAALLMLVPAAAAAQWNATAVGVTEYDTENSPLLLLGVSASPGGPGIAPLVGVQGSYLAYDAVERVEAFTVRPYAGLRSNHAGGSVYGTLGYAFSTRDDAFGAATADRGQGVVVSGGLDQWGTGGPLGFQLLGSYNFGSEAYWTRGRVTTRLNESSRVRVGGEVALLGGEDYEAWQPGGVVEWHTGGGRIIGLGAGVKLYEGDGDAFYVRLEAVLPLARR